jgi:hypothetical protein
VKAIPINPGEKYGRLTVVEGSPKSGSAVTVLCRCECGTEKRIRAQLLKNGQTKSCGCIRDELTRMLAVRTLSTHGLHSHPLYHTWNSMHRRCSNPKTRNYADYGGRGIRVCERWTGPEGLRNFIEDMGVKPSPKHTLERIDNDGNYEPGNCCWATAQEQERNKRPRVSQSLFDALLAENQRLRQRVAELEAGDD